jgi:lipopolysaccharide export system permease protein
LLLSLGCVWLYDVGEAWGQRGIQQVVVEQAEAIAYRYLRTRHTYSKEHLTINVKGVEGRKLIQPTLIMETEEQPEPVSVSAAEGELRTSGRGRALSILLRNGTAYVGDQVMMMFPDTIEQAVPAPAHSKGAWPPENVTIADLQKLIKKHQFALAAGNQADGALAVTDLGEEAAAREKTRQHLAWLKAQVNRRWTNGFFCLTFVMIGIPVAIRMRSRDYLSSFFTCFLPVVLINHPLHNFCIKMAEAGRAPPALPWAGDVVLFVVGVWMLYRLSRH